MRILVVSSYPPRHCGIGAYARDQVSDLRAAGHHVTVLTAPDGQGELTAELLLELKGRHTLIVIEHDMDFVRRLDTRVTVLNEGKVLADGSMDEGQEHPDVIEAYLGR